MTANMQANTNDSSSFALCFQGFEDRSPEALQRFKSFCETSLKLSSQDTLQILSHPGTAVICRKPSIYDLKEMACAFEEIGTRVSICGPSPDSIKEEVAEFASIVPQLEQLLAAPTIRVRPPPTLSESYEFTLDPEIRSLRARSIRTRTGIRRRRDNTATQMIGVILLVMVCLLGFNKTLTHQSIERIPPPLANIIERGSNTYPSHSSTTEPTVGVIKHYDGTVVRADYSLTLSIRAHEDSVSARLLLVTPSDYRREAGTTQELGVQQLTPARLRRAESDTTLLEQKDFGVWSGVLVTYLFIEHGGERRRVSTKSRISLRGLNEASVAHASIEILASSSTPGPIHKDAAVPIKISADGSYEIEISEVVGLERQLE